MSRWIQLESGFYRHRKTLRLKRLLGGSSDAYWLPPRLWSYCTDRESPDLSALTDDDLADVLEYAGDAAALRRALIDSGFLTPDGMTAEGWEERYGEKLKFYRERAQKAAAVRWGTPPAPSSHSSPNTPQEENTLEEREIRLGSTPKHSTSMLQASRESSASPVNTPPPPRLSIPECFKAGKALGCSPELADRLFIDWRQRKLAYGDAVQDDYVGHFMAQARSGSHADHILRERDARKNTYVSALDGYVEPDRVPPPDGWMGLIEDRSIVWEQLHGETQQFVIAYLNGKQPEPLPIVKRAPRVRVGANVRDDLGGALMR